MTANMKQQDFLVEVCAADLASVVAASQGGAGRIELCANLAEGGTTPSVGLVKTALSLTDIPLRVLIRPRAGDFSYDQYDVDAMAEDIQSLAQLGVSGFVIGALTPEGAIDHTVMNRLILAMGGLPWTFHRAFDFCADPLDALEKIITLGADTLLTSGQQPSALEGAGLIHLLNHRAEGRISIMAGAGIAAENIEQLRELTGCTHFHLSGRKAIPNRLISTSGAIMNAPGLHPDTIRKST
ncbi:MAG: copper homeostasis protein CutC, partial [Bacteroidales bacterium]